MRAADLDYELPSDLIAQTPTEQRDGARLLVVDPAVAGVAHHRVLDLPGIVPKALWILNDTRVIPARLFGQKNTGGKVELLLVERLSGDQQQARWLSMVKASKGIRPGARFLLGPGFEATLVTKREGSLWELTLQAADLERALNDHGQLPLPPYIERPPEGFDDQRYQTVYADKPGAVAAPTAGLHLTHALLGQLEAAGHRLAKVTLHVGPGTFAPLRAEHLADHVMHEERYHVPEATAEAVERARGEGMPILAVGTTVVRTLEAAATADGQLKSGPGSTALCIYPSYRFKVVDQLLTNFHLPRSTLLALVMAFGGEALIREAYGAAVAHRYRFFSYGDAMWIRRRA